MARKHFCETFASLHTFDLFLPSPGHAEVRPPDFYLERFCLEPLLILLLIQRALTERGGAAPESKTVWWRAEASTFTLALPSPSRRPRLL